MSGRSPERERRERTFERGRPEREPTDRTPVRSRSRSPTRGPGYRPSYGRTPPKSPPRSPPRTYMRRPPSPRSREPYRGRAWDEHRDLVDRSDAYERRDYLERRSYDRREGFRRDYHRDADRRSAPERPRPAPYYLDDSRDARPWRDRRPMRDRRDMHRPSERRDMRRPSLERTPSPPVPPPPPVRPQLATPIKVRSGPRPGTLSRRARARPAPLAERTFEGCSHVSAYELTVKLGQGTFGEVKKGRQSSTGRDVALKKVTIYDLKDGMPITALREIKLLKVLRHPYIVPVIDIAYRPPTERGKTGDVYMVEPYMDHDLNGLLDNPTIQLPMNQIKLYMRQLLEGTLFMHKNRILHRDMKAANLLIDNNGQLQIADFGLARPFYDPGYAWRPRGWKGGIVNYTDMVVTRWYRPPELLAGQRNYGPPIDMWGIGCILAEMVTGRPIFKGTSEIHQLELIASLCGSPNDENFPGWSTLPGVKNATPSGRPDTNPNVRGRHDFGRFPRIVKQHFTSVVDVGRECADLIDRLLVLDPCKRMTAAEALEHEWFWTKPYPADPASLPKYLPSKEIDRSKHMRAPGGHMHPGMPPRQGLMPGMAGVPPAVSGVVPGVLPGMAPGMPVVPSATVGGSGGGAYPAMPRLPAAVPPRATGSSAYPAMPRLPTAPRAPGQGGVAARPHKDYGWYQPSAPRGLPPRGPPRPYS